MVLSGTGQTWNDWPLDSRTLNSSLLMVRIMCTWMPTRLSWFNLSRTFLTARLSSWIPVDNTQLGYQIRRYLFEYGVNFNKAFSHGRKRRLYFVFR